MAIVESFPTLDGTPGTKYGLRTEGMYQVFFTEDPEAYSERHQPGIFEATRTLRCRWNDRNKFRLDLIGQAFKNADGTIHRYIPERHPDNQFMYCVGADLVKGKGRPSIDFVTGLPRFLDGPQPPTPEPDRPDQPSGGTVTYGWAEFVTSWQNLPYFVYSDDQLAQYGATREIYRFTRKIEQSASETITLPAAAFKWVSDQQPLPQGPVKVFYTKQIEYTWYKVPDPNINSIDSCLGKVNKVTFDGYDPGTVLFLAPDKIQDPSTYLYDITYKMLYRPKGWNKFFRVQGNVGVFADFSVDGTVSDADGNRLIDAVDLYTLWRLL